MILLYFPYIRYSNVTSCNQKIPSSLCKLTTSDGGNANIMLKNKPTPSPQNQNVSLHFCKKRRKPSLIQDILLLNSYLQYIHTNADKQEQKKKVLTIAQFCRKQHVRWVNSRTQRKLCNRMFIYLRIDCH